MANEFECLKGWLLAPSPTDGVTQVPFFVKVRGKDIVWDLDNLPLQIETRYKDGSNKKVHEVGQKITFRYDKWNIMTDSSGIYTATRAFDINEFSKLNDDTLDLHVTLPFISRFDEVFSVQATISSSDTDIEKSTTSVRVSEDSTNATLLTFRTRLHNTICRFYNTDHPNYIGSKVFITVTASLQI